MNDDNLLYFPMIKQHDGLWKELCQVLGNDHFLCHIINLAKKPEWTLKMMEANVDPYDLNLHGILDDLERLGLADSLLKKPQQENQMAQKGQEKTQEKSRKSIKQINHIRNTRSVPNSIMVNDGIRTQEGSLNDKDKTQLLISHSNNACTHLQKGKQRWQPFRASKQIPNWEKT
jgi:hypothetical protein